MEVPGSNYLQCVAALSIAFVSFSMIVAVARQVLGTVIPFHILLVRLLIESGVTATALSLLPPLLGLLGPALPAM